MRPSEWDDIILVSELTLSNLMARAIDLFYQSKELKRRQAHLVESTKKARDKNDVKHNKVEIALFDVLRSFIEKHRACIDQARSFLKNRIYAGNNAIAEWLAMLEHQADYQPVQNEVSPCLENLDRNNFLYFAREYFNVYERLTSATINKYSAHLIQLRIKFLDLHLHVLLARLLRRKIVDGDGRALVMVANEHADDLRQFECLLSESVQINLFLESASVEMSPEVYRQLSHAHNEFSKNLGKYLPLCVSALDTRDTEQLLRALAKLLLLYAECDDALQAAHQELVFARGTVHDPSLQEKIDDALEVICELISRLNALDYSIGITYEAFKKVFDENNHILIECFAQYYEKEFFEEMWTTEISQDNGVEFEAQYSAPSPQVLAAYKSFGQRDITDDEAAREMREKAYHKFCKDKVRRWMDSNESQSLFSIFILEKLMQRFFLPLRSAPVVTPMEIEEENDDAPRYTSSRIANTMTLFDYGNRAKVRRTEFSDFIFDNGVRRHSL